MPQGINENARAANEIREVLTSLAKIAHALGPIRNAYGKGHGRGRDFIGLEPRHARLAVGAASTFVDSYLIATFPYLKTQSVECHNDCLSSITDRRLWQERIHPAGFSNKG